MVVLGERAVSYERGTPVLTQPPPSGTHSQTLNSEPYRGTSLIKNSSCRNGVCVYLEMVFVFMYLYLCRHGVCILYVQIAVSPGRQPRLCISHADGVDGRVASGAHSCTLNFIFVFSLSSLELSDTKVYEP